MPTTDRHYRPRMLNRKMPQLKHSAMEIDCSIRYLVNPTSVGLYRLEARWLVGQGITALIASSSKEKIEKQKRSKEIIEMYTQRLQNGLEQSENLTFLFLLFKYLCTKKNRGESSETEMSLMREEYIFHLIDIDYDKVADEYKKALKFFEENIYYEGFDGHVGPHLSSVKSGAFLVMRVQDVEGGKHTEFVALTPKPLQDIAKFLELVEKINEPTHYTIFSPEEELLAPYIEVVRSMLSHISMPEGIQRHFKKMIADYDNDNFTGCVSTAGLVAEELLTQVYETLSRQPAPKNLMLGQMAERIGHLAKQLKSPSHKAGPLTRSDILNKVKGQKASKDIVNMFTFTADSLLQYIESRTNDMQHKLSDSKNGNTDFSLFPEIVKLSLDDVILYRNNASHKSTYPIDSLESLKSVYGSLGLLIWWN